MEDIYFRSIKRLASVILLTGCVTLPQARIQSEPGDIVLPDPTRNSVPTLVSHLNSPHPRIRRYAAYLLGQKGAAAGPAAVYLLTLIKVRDPRTRIIARNALTNLWQFTNADARDKLRAMLSSPDYRIRIYALQLLRALGPAAIPYRDELNKLLQAGTAADRSESARIMIALVENAAQLRPLLKYLEDPNPRVRRVTAQAVSRVSPEFTRELLPELRAGLRKGSIYANRGILKYLLQGHVDTAPFDTGLVAALDSRDPETRRLALLVLRKSPDIIRESAAKITRILDTDPSAGVRGAALLLAHKMGALRKEKFLAALQDRDSRIRLPAQSILRERSPGPVDLLPSLRSKSPEIVHYALRTFRSRAYTDRVARPEFIRAVIDLAAKKNCHAVRIIEMLGARRGSATIQSAASILRANLRHDICVRASARATARLGYASAGILRENFLRPRVHRYVREGILIGDAHVLPLLIRFLQDPRPRARREAANLLLLKTRLPAGHGKPARDTLLQALPALLRALEDSDARLRLTATRILTRMKTNRPRRIAALRKLLAHPNSRIRRRALRAAGEMGAQAAPLLPTVQAALKDPRTVHAALNALERFGPSARPALDDLLRMAKAEKRRRILGHVAWILPALDPRGRRIVPTLISIARKNPHETSNGAMEALWELGPRGGGALDFYREILRSDVSDSRLRGLRAVRALGQEAADAIPLVAKTLAAPRTNRERIAAARTLFELHEKRRPSPFVLRIAQRVFVQHEGEAADFALGLILKQRGPLNRALLFMTLLEPGDSMPALQAARRLGEFARADPKMRRMLQAFGRDDNPRARIIAATALAKAGENELARRIIRGLSHPGMSSHRRTGAGTLRLKALPYIEGPAAAEKIFRKILATREKSPTGNLLRRATLKAWISLGPISHEAAGDLSRWMRDPRRDLFERLKMARVLLHEKSPMREEARGYIMELVRDQPTVRNDAMAVLMKLGAEARSALPILRTVASLDRALVRRNARRAITWIETAISYPPGAYKTLPTQLPVAELHT